MEGLEGLVLIAGIVGAIWCAVFLLRTPLLMASLAVVLAGACVGYPFYNFFIGGTRWTVDRLMLPLLIAAFLIQRRLGRTQSKPFQAAEWLMVAMIVWLTASVFLHDFRNIYGHTASPIWRWGTAYCIPAVLYFIVRQSPCGPRRAAWVQSAFLVLGIYLALTGIFEVMRLWALVVPKHIADPTLGIHFGRARGPMLNSVSYGLYLGTCLLCLWAARDRFGRLAWPVVLGLTPLLLAGLYYSYTRSGWIGSGLGLLVVLAVSLRGRAKVLVVASVAAGAMLVSTTKLEKIVAFKREYSGSISKESAEARLSFAYVSWKMFQDSPVWGVGFGQFPTAKMSYLSDRVDLPLEQIRPLVHHNTFLCLLVETGAVGLILFVAILLAWVRDAWRMCRDPATPPWARRQAVLLLGVLPLYCCQLAFHELSYSTVDNCLVFLIAGIAMGARPAPAPATVPVHQRLLGQDAVLPSLAMDGRRNLGFQP